MKKAILMLSIIASSLNFTGCETPAQKVENAQNEVQQANRNLDNANEAYYADIENYRKISAEKIAANNKSIAEFNDRVQYQKKEAREDYHTRIAELEQRNTDMKKKMDDYKAQGRNNWEAFKSGFNHDLDELNTSINNLKMKDK